MDIRYCGGCGRRIKHEGIGWEAIDYGFGEGLYTHEDWDGAIFKHFPGDYWRGIEGHRDEYLRSIGVSIPEPRIDFRAIDDDVQAQYGPNDDRLMFLDQY